MQDPSLEPSHALLFEACYFKGQEILKTSMSVGSEVSPGFQWPWDASPSPRCAPATLHPAVMGAATLQPGGEQPLEERHTENLGSGLSSPLPGINWQVAMSFPGLSWLFHAMGVLTQTCSTTKEWGITGPFY